VTNYPPSPQKITIKKRKIGPCQIFLHCFFLGGGRVGHFVTKAFYQLETSRQISILLYPLRPLQENKTFTLRRAGFQNFGKKPIFGKHGSY
jgi:hypothetical protein